MLSFKESCLLLYFMYLGEWRNGSRACLRSMCRKTWEFESPLAHKVNRRKPIKLSWPRPAMSEANFAGCARQDSRLPSRVLFDQPLADNEKSFESCRKARRCLSRPSNRLALCAPARIRTWNDGFEDRSDIHFTTGAH